MVQQTEVNFFLTTMGLESGPRMTEQIQKPDSPMEPTSAINCGKVSSSINDRLSPDQSFQPSSCCNLCNRRFHPSKLLTHMWIHFLQFSREHYNFADHHTGIDNWTYNGQYLNFFQQFCCNMEFIPWLLYVIRSLQEQYDQIVGTTNFEQNALLVYSIELLAQCQKDYEPVYEYVKNEWFKLDAVHRAQMISPNVCLTCSNRTRFICESSLQLHVQLCHSSSTTTPLVKLLYESLMITSFYLQNKSINSLQNNNILYQHGEGPTDLSNPIDSTSSHNLSVRSLLNVIAKSKAMEANGFKQSNDILREQYNSLEQNANDRNKSFTENSQVHKETQGLSNYLMSLKTLHPPQGSTSSEKPIEDKTSVTGNHLLPLSYTSTLDLPKGSVVHQRRSRTRLSEEQLSILRSYFDINNSPTEDKLMEICMKTGLQEKVVKHWFRNTLFKERQRNRDNPYNFSIPPSTSLNLEEYEKTGRIEVRPAEGPDPMELRMGDNKHLPTLPQTTSTSDTMAMESNHNVIINEETFHSTPDSQSVTSLTPSPNNASKKRCYTDAIGNHLECGPVQYTRSKQIYSSNLSDVSMSPPPPPPPSSSLSTKCESQEVGASDARNCIEYTTPRHHRMVDQISDSSNIKLGVDLLKHLPVLSRNPPNDLISKHEQQPTFFKSMYPSQQADANNAMESDSSNIAATTLFQNMSSSNTGNNGLPDWTQCYSELQKRVQSFLMPPAPIYSKDINDPAYSDVPLDLSSKKGMNESKSSISCAITPPVPSSTLDVIRPVETYQPPVQFPNLPSQHFTNIFTPTTTATSGSTSSCNTRRNRTSITALQARCMHSIYTHHKTPSVHECDRLGMFIGLSRRVVQVWFQNQRAKEKKMARVSSSIYTSPNQGVPWCSSSSDSTKDPDRTNNACHICGITIGPNLNSPDFNCHNGLLPRNPEESKDFYEPASKLTSHASFVDHLFSQSHLKNLISFCSTETHNGPNV